MIVLNAGRIVKYEKFDGSAVNVRQDARINIAVRVKGSTEQLIQFLEEDNSTGEVSSDSTYVRACVFGQENELAALLRRLIAAEIKVIEFKIEKNSLKTAYFETLKEGE